MAKWIRNYLTKRDFEPDPEGEDDPWICVETDPSYRLAYVVGETGDPSRLQSWTTVRVPMHFWLVEEENEIIFRVMNEAAKENLRRVHSYANISPAFFAKSGFNLRVLLLNPQAEGRFSIPQKTEVFYTEQVPIDRVVGVGPPEHAGVYLTRGSEHGFVANKSLGLTSIYVFDPR